MGFPSDFDNTGVNNVQDFLHDQQQRKDLEDLLTRADDKNVCKYWLMCNLTGWLHLCILNILITHCRQMRKIMKIRVRRPESVHCGWIRSWGDVSDPSLLSCLLRQGECEHTLTDNVANCLLHYNLSVVLIVLSHIGRRVCNTGLVSDTFPCY